ncbi:uncharacterized protein B0H18DRAFT_883420 [Fomitopsis serialis]|uniref:uncharacterized protein n=1 Tax=Fomitopsis serialis TaxID=139415 RepID=UPI002008B5A0|nr:uncharacterized protein B0H18DRAFT_883420 [Neoantrodia serialis]KAH9917768.1 hypothetical protein B0H18DRAFT_883420 [Neoantrodia serialis]
MFAFTVLPVALAASALAMPAVLNARQDPCTALGVGPTSSLDYNFKLTVINPSVTNDPTYTGAPLALVSGDSNGLWWLKTASGDFSGWTLEKGALIPTPSSPDTGLVGSDMPVSAGSIVEFAVTNNGSANAGAGQTPYCAVSDAGGNATLTVNGDGNSFSVCQTPSLAWVLVYSASSDNGGAYTYESCTKQPVHLVQA